MKFSGISSLSMQIRYYELNIELYMQVIPLKKIIESAKCNYVYITCRNFLSVVTFIVYLCQRTSEKLYAYWLFVLLLILSNYNVLSLWADDEEFR